VLPEANALVGKGAAELNPEACCVADALVRDEARQRRERSRRATAGGRVGLAARS
jgi:hypothetical protein